LVYFRFGAIEESTPTDREYNKQPMEPRPDVIVDFVFEDGMLFVAVENIGSQPAVRIKVAFDPAFKGLGGTASIPEFPLFRNIEFLAPSRSIRTLLDSSSAYFARKEPERITVTTTYLDREGHRFSGTIVHDLAIYRDIAFIPKLERTS
jgi:hypothetical protein